MVLITQRIFAAGFYIRNHIKILKTVVKKHREAVFFHLLLYVHGRGLASLTPRLAALERIGSQYADMCANAIILCTNTAHKK